MKHNQNNLINIYCKQIIMTLPTNNNKICITKVGRISPCK
jgi:hypothetical protein